MQSPAALGSNWSQNINDTAACLTDYDTNDNITSTQTDMQTDQLMKRKFAANYVDNRFFRQKMSNRMLLCRLFQMKTKEDIYSSQYDCENNQQIN